MRDLRIPLAAAVLAFGTAPALAAGPDLSTPVPDHVRMARYDDTAAKAPYAMSYSDEAAQTLGMKNGRWEAFKSEPTNPLMPSFNAGVDGGGAMLRLQWR